MKHNESVEDFVGWFLHLFCVLNSDFLRQDFKYLVNVSLYGDPEPHDFPSSSTLSDHEVPQIAEEEATTPFVPRPPVSRKTSVFSIF